MIRNTADCQADVDRFVRGVTQSEEVWYLSDDSGVAYCESNEQEEEPRSVLLFFSDAAYAKRCQKAQFSEYELDSMSLFDFLFRWLPGMSGDGVLAGANWNQDLVGLELDPFEFREKIESALTPAKNDEYEAKYRELSNPEA